MGGKWLMKSSVALSLNLNISRIVIGMTVVSFATSSPELIVSIQAAISGYSNIAIGNAIGSNIANIGVESQPLDFINNSDIYSTQLSSN